MSKLWGGRFTGSVDPVMERFNESLSYDKRMYRADVRGSQAYAKGLVQAGVITEEESEKIHNGLEQVLKEWQDGTFKIVQSDEDIHTANERRLAEIIGSAAGKLHTGRSRNDQVATDMRIWLLEQVDTLSALMKDLLKVTIARAQSEIDHIMPGYTHLQRAQPIRWSHFLLSHCGFFISDLKRLQDLRPRISVLPLGSGPLAGNPFAMPRDLLQKELGFDSLSLNSMQGVADRDFIAEFLFWTTMVMVHISRLAEDLIIYSSSEFGFVTLSDAYSTGSSIMPQKKNPDSLELLRGKTGRVFGDFTGLLMTLKGVPSTYNKDLQEDKEPMFDAAHTIENSLLVLQGVISTMNIHPENMRRSLTDDMLATDLAEYLVRKGIPFRETHHISGSAVRLAEESKISLSQLTLEQLQSLSPKFEKDVEEVFSFETSVERRDVVGGTSRRAVLEQIETVKAVLEK
ncbi:argininosuccinate lyase [Cystobasidium minutum MCA 4210]|uniref:argininosuccinate lyase n=1 Tax=Cystobasidium minutum MCA 4210 TaxID=1397322 RepID=UPI0034CF09E6|eukprot:jgi/Rhomi1/140391/e_gw1.2.1136.1